MKILFSIFVFFILSTFLSATIINVPADQPTIQAGINAAVDADTVLVQPETYVENINYNGKNITVASLFLTTQDTTYISQTLIDGDSIGSVVTYQSGEDSTAVLCGFTITNGFNNQGSGEPSGGGINCYESSPTLSDLLVINNYGNRGGGINCHTNSSPIIKNVLISNNIAEGRGGGFSCEWNSNPYLLNIVIDNNNTIISRGGGIFVGPDCSPIFNTISVINNYAWDRGGGVYCNYGATPIFDNAIISDNTAGGNGGGISAYYDCIVQLTNTVISGNSSEGYSAGRGGGCQIVGSSSAILKNVVISNNISDFGGGIYFHGSFSSYFILENVTITENTALTGGGIYSSEAAFDLTNCIMWNDSPEEIYFSSYDDPNSITISYSDIQGGEAGIVTNNNGTVNWLEGNIDEDPLFVGTGGYPYSLLEDSPCIDAGNPDPIYYDPEDPSNPGYALYPAMGTIINDMGAFGGPNVIGWPAVDIEEPIIPNSSSLISHLSNYPNPFNPSTTISFSTTESTENTEIIIYNIKGQKIKKLGIRNLKLGINEVIWNGKDENNKPVSSGIYFYKLKAGKYSKIKKMLLLK